MKNISLPNRELQLLSNMLQNFNQGFTVAQIRSLDKVIQVLESVLEPFTKGLSKIAGTELLEGKEKAEKQKEIDKFLDTEGGKKVSCTFEDADFDFILAVWSRVSSLRGAKEVREAVLKIDDAIKSASPPVFEKGVN